MDFSFSGLYDSGNSEYNKSIRRQKIIRMLAFFIALLLCLPALTGCTSSSDNIFPKVTQPAASDSTTSSGTAPLPSVTPGETSSDTTILKIAAPISYSTAQYLAKLYTAKKSGNWSEQESGSTVALDQLDAIDPAFSVEIIQTPSTGATQDTFDQWKKNGFVPDIIYTDAMASLADSKDILPLSHYAASNALFLPTNLYTSMLSSCSIDDEIYGIPYSSSAEILYMNMSVLSAAGVNAVPFDLDLDTMNTMSEAVKNMSVEGTPLEQQSFALYKASDLVPFLPSSYSDTAGWFMFNGSAFDFQASAFSDAVNYLRSYVKAGYSVESLTAQDQGTAFSSLDPRLSARVAMWVGSSAEVARWSINHSSTLSISQIPAEASGKVSRLALTVYPLCVASETKSPQLACDFASFMALDEDAILLSTRLEKLDGLLPVVSSTTVWEAVCLQQTFGEELLLLQAKVPDAYYNPLTNHKPEYDLSVQIMTDFRTQFIDETVDLQTLISQLSAAKITS